MAWININIGDDLHKKVKVKAAEEGKEIREVVIKAIREYLEES